MRFFAAFLALALTFFAPAAVQAKSVFAHFMVGNTEQFKFDDWVKEIAFAQAARIDAFALNIAYDDYVVQLQLPLAFSAAEATGFKLFFSFDYAGNGPWPKEDVSAVVNHYGASSAYFRYGGKPFVSTFEGPEQYKDWTDIKSETGCFFIPDWSSLGAKEAMALGTADGLFSWEGWPNGPNDARTYGDASYFQYLNGAPYMAPISPWFYTNMPGYNKNWLWRGDDMWFDRWQQLIVGEKQPEFVQIISWNDYGESHYIGPLDDRQYVAFGPDFGKAPFNYVKNMPHDGWRQFLPFVIELWKTGTATVQTEGVTAWFRPNPATACSDGGTTGNTASHLQLEFHPQEIVKDKVFYSALLGADATVTVFIGGKSIPGDWSNKPYGNVGVFHGSVETGGAQGNVVVRITRDGSTVMETSGKGAITAGCSNGMTNFNAYVDAGTGGSSGKKTPKAIKDLVSIAGTGINEFVKLCEFTCKYGYCPEAACTATSFGDPREKPDPTGTIAYPAEGKSKAFEGLCNYACNLGYCPTEWCSLTEKPTYEGDVSPFVQPACTSGTGPGQYEGLCKYACDWGYCPIRLCTCMSTGALHLPTPEQEGKITKAFTTDGSPDYGLCLFACSRGYCPDPCTVPGAGSGPPVLSPDPGTGGGTVGYTLLSILSDYTLVNMWPSVSDEVEDALVGQTCSIGSKKRAHSRRHDLKKRASNQCISNTVSALLREAELASMLVGLYRGNPIPGTLLRISQLPAFATTVFTDTFINGLSAASNLLSAAVSGMTTEEIVWVYYAMFDSALQHISYHPDNFEKFAVERIGNMPAQCPDEATTDCDSKLCKSKDGTYCSGFLGSSCRCSQSRCKIKYSNQELKPFCSMPQCMPVDPKTGLCTADTKYKDCTCAGPIGIDNHPLMFDNDLNQLWLGPDWKGDGSAPSKPDYTLCYKKGDATHTARADSVANWHYMEQSVLAKNIESFCKEHGNIKGGSGGGSVSTYSLNPGTMNEVTMKIEYKEDATLTVDECKSRFNALSANCDWHAIDNQYNWKWGGEFTTGLFTFIIDPKGERFPVRNDPDTDWWRVGNSRHYFNNGKTAKDGEERIGKYGKPYNVLALVQCMHHLYFDGWNKGAAKKCGDYGDLSMAARVPYDSHNDLFENTWRMFAWKLQYENILCGYSNHKAGVDGNGGATGWLGMDCW